MNIDNPGTGFEASALSCNLMSIRKGNERDLWKDSLGDFFVLI
jgi:hypothetical protein